jgi:hypothetical protein
MTLKDFWVGPGLTRKCDLESNTDFFSKTIYAISREEQAESLEELFAVALDETETDNESQTEDNKLEINSLYTTSWCMAQSKEAVPYTETLPDEYQKMEAGSPSFIVTIENETAVVETGVSATSIKGFTS